MIALLTPTGGRAEQIKICEYLMRKQTYTGRVVWFISDDCVPVTIDNIGGGFPENWVIEKLYPRPAWVVGQNTQGRNIQYGIETIMAYKEKFDAIFIIEDDDYYKPVYLERMIPRLDNYLVAGEQQTIYYNVRYRRHANNNNLQHASLFQVAMRPEAVEIFKKCYGMKFIDAHFFNLLNKVGVNLFFENFLAVGMKGMSGRGGIGAGHSQAMNMLPDPEMKYLQSLIGIQDAKIYERYYSDYRQPRYDVLTRKGRK